MTHRHFVPSFRLTASFNLWWSIACCAAASFTTKLANPSDAAPTPNNLPVLLVDCHLERLFFFEAKKEKVCRSYLVRSATHCESLPQSANTANAKSRSTSCEAGVSPSAPTEPGSSRKVSATARAAVQDNKAPQRKRQACSARRRKSNPSQRARARARALIKC